MYCSTARRLAVSRRRHLTPHGESHLHVDVPWAALGYFNDGEARRRVVVVVDGDRTILVPPLSPSRLPRRDALGKMKQAADLASQGMENHEIAETLGVDVRTVRRYLQRSRLET